MPEINYLDGAENQYGLPATMPQGLGEQASVIVNNYIKRPEGLLYEMDVNGNPCFMTGLQPSFTYTMAGGVPAGSNVTVTVTPASVRPNLVGEVIILERGAPEKQEAVIVQSVTGNNQITFASVQFTHTGNVKGDIGCVITEERNVPPNRSVVRYTRSPCVSIIALAGRYGQGRRSTNGLNQLGLENILTSVATFGGPPAWTPIDLNQVSWSDATSEIWVPAGMLMSYYSDIRIKYVAGYVEPPDVIVRACASIAASIVASGALGGTGVKMLQAGGSRIERFSASFMDNDIRLSLDAFKTKLFY